MKNRSIWAGISLAAIITACGTTSVVTTSDVSEVEISSANSTVNDETMVASDTVMIGTQVWKTKNLNTITFRNGDTLLHARSNEEWVNAAKNQIPAWCYADNNDSNGELYGKLYNYWAVIDQRGLAPIGWRIPTDTDFAGLVASVGASSADKLKSTTLWENGGNGSNSTGFNAFPGGYRNATGLFNPLGRLCAWWTTTEKSSGSAFGYKIIAADNMIVQSDFYKRSGLYVRCIR